MRNFRERETSPSRPGPARRSSTDSTLTAQVQAMQRAAGNAAVSQAVVPVVQRMMADRQEAAAGPSSGAGPAPAPIRDEAQELRDYRRTVTDERVGRMMDEALNLLSQITFVQNTSAPDREVAGAHTTRAGEDAGGRRYTVNYTETTGQASAPPGAPDRMAVLFHELTHALLNEQLDDSDMINHRVPALSPEALNADDNALRAPGAEEGRQRARIGLANAAEPNFRLRRRVYVEQRVAALRALVPDSGLTEEHRAGALDRLAIMENAASLEYDPILTHLMVWANADGLQAGNPFYDRLAALLDEARAARDPDAAYPIASAAETDTAYPAAPAAAPLAPAAPTARRGGIVGVLQRVWNWVRRVFHLP
ncbi:hypothetical protein Asp14428_74820 [Actinoplanes sp. NBRC 14428]|nr:hypothetical protein Asp14428_74820 [Actinoplanes sp. NBRC 14428]